MWMYIYGPFINTISRVARVLITTRLSLSLFTTTISLHLIYTTTTTSTSLAAISSYSTNSGGASVT